ncbi:MAG: carboxypeptidase-like regulatory domain-containing protein [Actinomycetota bacterium]
MHSRRERDHHGRVPPGRGPAAALRTSRALILVGTVQVNADGLLNSGNVVNTVHTDSQGRFRIDVAPGRYSLTGRSPGFQGGGVSCSSRAVDVGDNQAVTVNVNCGIK